MEFRILGPLYADAGTGSGPAVLGQPLLQSALAVLLLRANRTCSRPFLIDALWGSEPPAAPEAALRVCISRLRSCLGDCAGRLQTIGPPGGRAPVLRQQRGYVMHVRPGELDADEFSDLAAQGQSELDIGNAAAAAASFVQALALWGDPPLPDLPDSPALAADVTRLAQHRRTVMDALIDARLAVGEHEQLLGQLRAAVAAEPGRERTCEQLMRACHSLGLRKEALEVYQTARRVTLEQQGAEPGPALSVLYRRILAEETAMDPTPPTVNSGAMPGPLRPGQRLPGAPPLTPLPRGPRLPRPQAPAPLPTGPRPPVTPPLTPLPPGPQLPGPQAPAPPADFTGRSAELAAVVAGLSGPGVPIAIVSGAPGIGKTAAAVAAALQLREQFADGQLYAELGGLERPRDPQDVLAELLQAIGVTERNVPAAGPPRAALYRSLLADRRILVIADDAASAMQVRPLIPAAGGAGVIVTSRSRLSGLAGARHIELGGLDEADALVLLCATAGPDRISADSAAAHAVAAICGGLPLALRLAGEVLAARPGLTVHALAAELASDRVLEILVAEDVSVRETIGTSYRALSAFARSALSAVALTLPGEIPANELVAAADGDATVPAQLTGVGLLAPARLELPGEYYSIHPLIRRYAAMQANANTHPGAD
ncbi:MAG TPA: BTAD domain-containing putative transcriptional regulator [Streptosporangiaceae bacterium]|nr:BTAD domain-containing putative transcriptional regulator [Streptosporangiaceae bacterium]